MKKNRLFTVALTVLCMLMSAFPAAAESGYSLWLRYVQVSDAALLSQYRTNATQIVFQDTSAATLAAAAAEMKKGLDGLLVQTTPTSSTLTMDGAIVAGTPAWADTRAESTERRGAIRSHVSRRCNSRRVLGRDRRRPRRMPAVPALLTPEETAPQAPEPKMPCRCCPHWSLQLRTRYPTAWKNCIDGCPAL